MDIPDLPWPSIMAAFGITLLLLWIGIPFAHKIGWVDHPNHRKLHPTATPMMGGIAMYGGYATALILLDSFLLPSWKIFLFSSGILLILGCLDDCLSLRVKFRFFGELGIALIMVLWGDVVIHSLGNVAGFGIVTLGIAAIPFTIICIIGVINAVNMSDGLDGQAGGQSLIAFIMLFFLAAHAGRWPEAWWMLLASVVLMPFLWFNSPFGKGAKVFMGDAGSMFLGITLAWFTIILSQGANPALTPVTAVWLLAIPLIDLFSSIVRRLMKGHPPFSSDLGHIHHLLLKQGFNKKQVFLIMVGLSLLCALIGVLAPLLAIPEALLFYGLLTLFVGYCWLSFRW